MRRRNRVFRVLAKDLPRVDEIGLDWRIVVYSLISAVAATLACGIVPAISGTRRSLAGSLASSGRWQVSGRRPAQFALVGVQVALAVTLLAGAGLLLRTAVRSSGSRPMSIAAPWCRVL